MREEYDVEAALLERDSHADCSKETKVCITLIIALSLICVAVYATLELKKCFK